MDANVFLAVALDEPEKRRIIELTGGRALASPEVLPFELGNALSALGRLDRDAGQIEDEFHLLNQAYSQAYLSELQVGMLACNAGSNNKRWLR